jgi:hypothetical protein
MRIVNCQTELHLFQWNCKLFHAEAKQIFLFLVEDADEPVAQSPEDDVDGCRTRASDKWKTSKLDEERPKGGFEKARSLTLLITDYLGAHLLSYRMRGETSTQVCFIRS